MRKNLVLIGVLLVLLSACGAKESTAIPVDVSALQTSAVQTVFAGVNQTATANAPTNTPVPTATATFAMTVNGQLQGTLAFIRNYNLWVSINGVEIQLTIDAVPTELPNWTGLPQLWYSNPQISPDGTQVAYLRNTTDKSDGYSETRALMISDIDGKNARQLTNDVAWEFPTAEWSGDSQRIYYSVSNGFDTTTGLETTVIRSINPTTGDVAEHGQFSRMLGCGGGSEDLADYVSGREGIGRLGHGMMFALSPQNNYVIHTAVCSYGLGVLDLMANQDITLDDTVDAAAISADGSKIAAISKNNIIIFNTTGGSQTFPANELPQALLWTSNGTELLYSTAKPVGTRDLDETAALDIYNGSPRKITLYVSTLWKISLDNGESTKIIEMDAHDLRPIFVTDEKVLVAAVENANMYFDYLAQGNRENLAEHYPNVNLVEIDLASLTSNIIMHKTIQADYFSTK